MMMNTFKSIKLTSEEVKEVCEIIKNRILNHYSISKDKNDIETEIISIKFDRMFYDVTLDIDGELYIVRLDSLSHIYITMIYLRLQDMIRKFND